MSTSNLLELAGLGGTILSFLARYIYMYGRNIEVMTQLRHEVKENRDTQARFGERLGRLETRGEVEREYTGRVRND